MQTHSPLSSVAPSGSCVNVYRARLQALPRLRERERATVAELQAATAFQRAYAQRNERGSISHRKAFAALATYKAAIARTDKAQAAILALLPTHSYTMH